MTKRLLIMLVIIVLSVAGCIGVGYHGETRVGSHGYGYVDLTILPYLGFFMYPGFFGYYDDHSHHHGNAVIHNRHYIYRNPVMIIHPSRRYY